jgi:hypothetical protein
MKIGSVLNFSESPIDNQYEWKSGVLNLSESPVQNQYEWKSEVS